MIFCGRNKEAGEKIATENKCQYIQVDVTKHEEVESFFKQVNLKKCSTLIWPEVKIKEKHGRLDVLINNAGVGARFGRQADIAIEDYLRIMNVNMNGAWYTLKYGVKLMEEAGNGGRVVNISSICGNSGSCTKVATLCSHNKAYNKSFDSTKIYQNDGL